MSDRPAIEKEIADNKRTINQVEKDVKQLRDWISSNERGLTGMQETLRRITEDGISKARNDLAQRETNLQQLREALAQNERVMQLITEIERKQHDITTLEREQEKIIVLLERHQSELRQLQRDYDTLMRPASSPPCELVLPNNQRIPLDVQHGDYVVGWHDQAGPGAPDIDLHAAGGSTSGVSRRHAVLRFTNGQWTITDLGSTNGTSLNNVAVAPNTPTVIQDKTRIRLGQMLIFFRYITQTTRL